jgi:hypothetical protein
VAFLDFLKNRTQTQQPVAQKPQEQKPESAKEMYTRQSGQERAARNPIDRMPAEQREKVDAIKATLEKATQHRDGAVQMPAAEPEAMGNREAARQNMTGQDKAAPALSPTSGQAGTPATEKESPANAPEKPARPQSLPRPKPSWER